MKNLEQKLPGFLSFLSPYIKRDLWASFQSQFLRLSQRSCNIKIMRNLILFLVFLLFQDQSNSQSTTERPRTEKCDADEFDEMVRDHIACVDEAAKTASEK